MPSSPLVCIYLSTWPASQNSWDWKGPLEITWSKTWTQGRVSEILNISKDRNPMTSVGNLFVWWKILSSPIYLQVECLHYCRTSRILLCARVPNSWGLYGVFLLCILSRAGCLMRQTGKQQYYFFSLPQCGVLVKGIKFSSSLFPCKEWKKNECCFSCVGDLAKL